VRRDHVASTLATKVAETADASSKFAVVGVAGLDGDLYARCAFEWHTDPATGRKQPYRFAMKSGEPFAMAGIYARSVNHELGEAESALKTFAILTTTANEVMAPIHDRMPVILPLGREKEWLQTDRCSLRQERYRNVVTLPCIFGQQCGRAGKYPQTTK
jgi:hypothetical protein